MKKDIQLTSRWEIVFKDPSVVKDPQMRLMTRRISEELYCRSKIMASSISNFPRLRIVRAKNGLIVEVTEVRACGLLRIVFTPLLLIRGIHPGGFITRNAHAMKRLILKSAAMEKE